LNDVLYQQGGSEAQRTVESCLGGWMWGEFSFENETHPSIRTELWWLFSQWRFAA